MTSKVTVTSHNGNGKGIDVVITEKGYPEPHVYHVEDNSTMEFTIWHDKEITSIREVTE